MAVPPLTRAGLPFIIYNQSMWGYAEGNPWVVALVVGTILVAAIAYVGHKIWRSRR